MARLLSGIRAIARQKLNDELKGSDVAYKWTDDELDVYTNDCLIEMSKYSPYEVKETVTTVASSREIDLSSIDDLLEVKEVEYPVDKQPRRFRQFSVWGDILRIELDTAPSAVANVYLYCKEYHSLSDTASTLNPNLERILVLGVCGQAAVAKAQTKINKVNKAVGVAGNLQSWGLAQLSLYYTELNKLVTADSFKEYPTD